jgi:hypothetical protein
MVQPHPSLDEPMRSVEVNRNAQAVMAMWKVR